MYTLYNNHKVVPMKNKILIPTILTVLSAPLINMTCCSKHNYKQINIEMSQETRNFIDNMGYEVKYLCSEEGWPTYKEVLIEYAASAADYPLFPAIIEYQSNFTEHWDGDPIVSSFQPKSASYDKIIIYLHGGAYVLPSDASHTTYCDYLACHDNALVIAPSYGLSPRYCYKETFDKLDEVYTKLLALNKPIFISGDSSGGGIALAYTLYRKERGLKLPKKVFVSSPWVDVTMTNPAIPQYEDKDHTLAPFGLIDTGRWWSGDLPDHSHDDVKIPTTDYKISPINGNYKDFPETLVFYSTWEILYPDGIKLINILKTNGVKTTFVYLKGFVHAANLYPNFSEYQQMHNIVSDFLK